MIPIRRHCGRIWDTSRYSSKVKVSIILFVYFIKGGWVRPGRLRVREREREAVIEMTASASIYPPD
jgi:hypothetical protein